MVNSSCITFCSLLVNWGATWISSYVFDRDHRVHLFNVSRDHHLNWHLFICGNLFLHKVSVNIHTVLWGDLHFGASLGCLCILAVILGLIGPIILPLCIPITIYFLLWVKWIKQQIYISKVYWITLLTLVTSAIVPVSCVYIFL